MRLIILKVKTYAMFIVLMIMSVSATDGHDRKTVTLRKLIQIQEPNLDLRCTTPDNQQSTCISLFSCPGLMKALGTLDKTSIQHVRKSICPITGSGELFVCCGKLDRGDPTNTTSPVLSPIPPMNSNQILNAVPPKNKEDNKLAHREMVKKNLLPSTKQCGYQHTDDRIYNSSQTAVDEYPWLVHIKITDHEYEEEYGDRCSGVLISARYVLTDAYCAFHAIRVVVGEHRTDTNISCVADMYFEECADEAFAVGVEKIIRDGKRENGPYDFALLRLQKSLSFTEYIRPLCLPFDSSRRPNKTETLIFSGWGSKGPGVSIKKRIAYEQAADQVCYDSHVGVQGNVKFANVSLLCVKAKNYNEHYACHGDHGGALMYSRRKQWFAESIVISVFSDEATCVPNSVVSSIRILPKTLDWILDSMKP